MDDLISYILSDIPISDSYNILPVSIFPKVNLTNFHSSIWAIMNVHKDRFRGNNREMVNQALSLLDSDVSYEDLYEVMDKQPGWSFHDYPIDKDAALSYAKIIVNSFTTEENE